MLHAGVIAVTFFTWTHKLDIIDQSTPIVPVDLVTLADKTNVAPMVTQEPKPQPIAEQPTSPPLPMSMQPPKFEVAPEAKPAPVQKPAPKQEAFDINNILAMLDKRQAAAAKNAKVGSQNIKGVGLQNAMTADLRSMLQSQIYRCWSPPVGAPHPEKLIVSYDLFLNPRRFRRTVATIDCRLLVGRSERPVYARGGGSGAAGDLYLRAIQIACRPV